jgi:hypothetical protein
VAGLIRDLDADDFDAREKAEAELVRLGQRAGAALRRALAGSPSLEARRRLQRVVARLKPGADPEEVRAARAIGVLEALGSRAARAELRALLDAGSAAAEARAALGRLGETGGPR